MSSAARQLDIQEILKVLPHRYPFIMVDRILELEIGTRIRGLKNVTMNENFFQGHFPSNPVMPGVLILEGMAQTGAILAFLSLPDDFAQKLVYFAAIDAVKFRQVVGPGDQLHYELTATRKKSLFWKMEGKAYVGDKLVAEAELMATFR